MNPRGLSVDTIAIRLRPNLGQIMVGLQSDSDRIAAEIWPNCDRNSIGLRPESDRIAARIWPDCGRNLTGLWSDSDRIAVEIWPDCDRNPIELRLESRRNPTGLRLESCQILATNGRGVGGRNWPKFLSQSGEGQIRLGVQPDCGWNLAKFWPQSAEFWLVSAVGRTPSPIELQSIFDQIAVGVDRKSTRQCRRPAALQS